MTTKIEREVRMYSTEVITLDDAQTLLDSLCDEIIIEIGNTFDAIESEADINLEGYKLDLEKIIKHILH